ncbi:MAG: DUF433 domain-containing protein [Candidatus Schekmanbacteria bacterium]|nr:DUF433 domain-containing protein [Candidatus Schekmanbacteria bacterium]
MGDLLVDPWVAFGKPTVAGHGISTAAIARRIDAGETVADLARDYDLLPEQIEGAVVYEQAA